MIFNIPKLVIRNITLYVEVVQVTITDQGDLFCKQIIFFVFCQTRTEKLLHESAENFSKTVLAEKVKHEYVRKYHRSLVIGNG